MQILNPDMDLSAFWCQMERAPQKALLMDYDGTLAPFNVNPQNAFPYPGVCKLLDEIMQVPGVHLAIISGRWIKDLLPLLQLKHRPEVWGSHGLERLKADGTYEVTPMEEKALRGLAEADEWIDAHQLGGRSEKKPGCLAIHWRGLNEKTVSDIRNQAIPEWSNIAVLWGLSVNEFDGGLEIRVPARDKGDAVRTILHEFGADTVAAYLGDDLTDEDAFRSIKGRGIGVLVRKELRPTVADIWITPPEGLIHFLACWLPEPYRSSFLPFGTPDG